MKKTAIFIIGLLLIIGVCTGNNLKRLKNWDSPESAGYNTWIIFAVITGIYLMYKSIKNK